MRRSLVGVTEDLGPTTPSLLLGKIMTRENPESIIVDMAVAALEMEIAILKIQIALHKLGAPEFKDELKTAKLVASALRRASCFAS